MVHFIVGVLVANPFLIGTVVGALVGVGVGLLRSKGKISPERAAEIASVTVPLASLIHSIASQTNTKWDDVVADVLDKANAKLEPHEVQVAAAVARSSR